MALDVKLAQRVRRLLNAERSFEEKRMFGGLAFIVNGHMRCGVLNKHLGKWWIVAQREMIPAAAEAN